MLLFVLGVGVPSLLLGYLAFRGIQNDQALLEKENREELQSLSNKLTVYVDENIVSLELNFERALDEGLSFNEYEGGLSLRQF